jgi:hypothetical protein
MVAASGSFSIPGVESRQGYLRSKRNSNLQTMFSIPGKLALEAGLAGASAIID